MTKELLTSFVSGGDCVQLRKSRPALQSESEAKSLAEIPLVIRNLQK